MLKAVILLDNFENKRIMLGASIIAEALIKQGFSAETLLLGEDFDSYRQIEGEKIFLGERKSRFIVWLENEEILLYHSKIPGGEGFYLERCPGNLTVVSGGSDTGALYGSLELFERIDLEHGLPRELAFYDAPVFKLRGPAIGLQKTKIEPPRLTYEYPITPERFPWFYDKETWQKFLDFMLYERCNVLYIWSGHPFSSLVKVKEYPEALEVTDEEFEKNRELFSWLTEECDRRGIWVVLKFYNIHIPYPFAVHHKLELLQSNITPLVADYTSKSIIEFIRAFPHIGLMVCLGEALRGTQNKTDWFVKTIIPAVLEGIEKAGLKEQPPIILRGHDCDPYAAMQEASKLYKNIYTMWKYNGEGLTTYYPRGKWQEIHRSLNGLGEAHIMNVHILANLEPFRFNAPEFIRKCIEAGQNRLGVNGLHLYPLFYWDWPYSPDLPYTNDASKKRLVQLERDFIWFSAWFRYAWNPERDPKTEKIYWADKLSKRFCCSEKCAAILLEAMESSASIAPRILGRVGITEGNRQTMSLGMTMSQFTNVLKYRPNKELWNSVARKGEQPDDFVKHQLENKPHVGETPMDMIDDIMFFAENAMKKYSAAKLLFTDSSAFSDASAEFERIGTDIEALYFLTVSYSEKIMAALKILEYKHTMNEDCSGDLGLLESALPGFEKSLEYYRKLTEITEKTYLYANSMQTRQRKIPFSDGDFFGHWSACLPEYEKELVNFKKNLNAMKNGFLPGNDKKVEEVVPLIKAKFEVLSDNCEKYEIEKGSSVFSEFSCPIKNLAPELMGLSGVRFSLKQAIEEGVSIRLDLQEDCLVLIGYMNAKGVEWLAVPNLETNTHADDRGGLEPVYLNSIKAEGCPAMNVHVLRYEKGVHEIYFGTGGFVIAGIVKKGSVIVPRNADLAGEGFDTLDWLYE